jgi:hypothetical protein
VITSTVSAIASVGALTVWLRHTLRRSEHMPPDRWGPAATVERTPSQIAGVVTVAAAAVAALVLPSLWTSRAAGVAYVAGIVLTVAVILRLYRFARPAPPGLDRLLVALVLVAASALMLAALLAFALAKGRFPELVYVTTGAAAFAGGTVWLWGGSKFGT